MPTAPDEIPIRAVVAYHGGETQEREFVLDIKNRKGAGRVAQSPEELELSRKWLLDQTMDVGIGFVGGNSGTPETGWVDEDTYIVYWDDPKVG